MVFSPGKHDQNATVHYSPLQYYSTLGGRISRKKNTNSMQRDSSSNFWSPNSSKMRWAIEGTPSRILTFWKAIQGQMVKWLSWGNRWRNCGIFALPARRFTIGLHFRHQKYYHTYCQISAQESLNIHLTSPPSLICFALSHKSFGHAAEAWAAAILIQSLQTQKNLKHVVHVATNMAHVSNDSNISTLPHEMKKFCSELISFFILL